MWLALRFPHWALDSRAAALDAAQGATLVVASEGGRRIVAAAGPDAVTAGVRRGMALADAQVRMPQASVVERHAFAEQAALERLAGWAWRYSDQVHIARENDTVATTRLILEIGASLRLFGGRRALLARIRGDLNTLGYRYRAGLGGTPAMALVWARAPRQARGRDLSGLPLACLALEPRVRASLEASGLRRIGELLALPPALLQKRYGSPVLESLERLRGRRPHGLSLYRLPERHVTRHELFGAIEHVQGLLFVLHRIFEELDRVLRGADAAIQTLRLALIHDEAPTTRLTLRLSAPSRKAAHFHQVAEQRLARLELAAPVLEVALATDRLRRHEPDQSALWQHDSETNGPDHWPAVLDRLRARLGDDAVGWLQAPADHRPERASRCDRQPPAPAAEAVTAPRPVWLVDPPRPAPADLRLVAGPERIETGWWDGAGVRRDYFRAIDGDGRQLWVYRCLDDEAPPGAPATGGADTAARYYVHGLFG